MSTVTSVSNYDSPLASQGVAPKSNGLFTWRPTNADRLEQSEALMLRGIKYQQCFVAGLNTISNVEIRRGGSGGDRDIMVLIHGFAGGLACWAQNWEFFSAQYELYAVDLPGFGRSERRDVNVESLEGAMGFICAYLDRWFGELEFTRPVILLGHSFGGFIAAHYAVASGPRRVKLLALADPWGVNEADHDRVDRAPVVIRMALKMFYAINPLAPLRAAGPAGPKLFRMVRPDFANRWKSYLDDPKVFYDYTYHCNAQLPPVGEKLFKACCHGDVAAKKPLIETLPMQLSKEIPLAVLYGSHTWMNAERGFTMVDIMREKGYRVRAGTIMNAGHQVFTDNAQEFNEQMLQALHELLNEENAGDSNIA
ncbi:putative monoglyceride lipase [Trypanosoma grayi]|uniref:putative monoglyceride lipase n=1 Tax=Trypanosoma grayi TaxID=71804 RepID=UPI0004F4BAEF|nr:putative monoglyceride lipase [Trypanosoma grayi]KEG07935.1 putative monoglyceride lipase [Trypanosoma grayi]